MQTDVALLAACISVGFLVLVQIIMFAYAWGSWTQKVKDMREDMATMGKRISEVDSRMQGVEQTLNNGLCDRLSKVEEVLTSVVARRKGK